MSKKTTKTPAAKTKVAAKAKPLSSPVRYSAIPKAVIAAPAVKVEVTADMIATRAFELYAAGREGGQLDHWLAAEAELRVAA